MEFSLALKDQHSAKLNYQFLNCTWCIWCNLPKIKLVTFICILIQQLPPFIQYVLWTTAFIWRLRLFVVGPVTPPPRVDTETHDAHYPPPGGGSRLSCDPSPDPGGTEGSAVETQSTRLHTRLPRHYATTHCSAGNYIFNISFHFTVHPFILFFRLPAFF